MIWQAVNEITLTEIFNLKKKKNVLIKIFHMNIFLFLMITFRKCKLRSKIKCSIFLVYFPVFKILKLRQ